AGLAVLGDSRREQLDQVTVLEGAGDLGGVLGLCDLDGQLGPLVRRRGGDPARARGLLGQAPVAGAQRLQPLPLRGDDRGGGGVHGADAGAVREALQGRRAPRVDVLPGQPRGRDDEADRLHGFRAVVGPCGGRRQQRERGEEREQHHAEAAGEGEGGGGGHAPMLRGAPAAGRDVHEASTPSAYRVLMPSPQPPYEQVRREIVEQVRSGELRPGDRLPALRAHAADLGLAAGTVAGAYKLVEEEQIIGTGRGAGTTVARDAMAHARRAAETVRREGGGPVEQALLPLFAGPVAEARTRGARDVEILRTVRA